MQDTEPGVRTTNEGNDMVTTDEKLDLILRNQARIARAIEELILGVSHGDEIEQWRDTQGHDRAQTQMLRVVRDVADALEEDFAGLYGEGGK